MALHRFFLPALLLCLLGSLALNASATGEAKISPVSFLDHQYMAQQRRLIEDVTRRHFGTGFSGDTDRDLELLQRVLDHQLVTADQRRELQAMGMILGELLAGELKLQWVIYEDRLGRSRALRDGNTDNYLFPMTMISRRVEAGSDLPVAEIYRKAYETMAATQSKLPFQ